MSHRSIAIVVPIYNELACLPPLYRAYCELFSHHAGYRWRVVFVDDGSTDGSLAWLKKTALHDERVVCIELSRNFGHQSAITAGLSSVSDVDAVIMMDGDMQDPPSLIASMLKQFEAGAEVVLAKRLQRSGRGWRRWGNWLFHRLLIRMSDLPLTSDVGIYALMARPVIQQLNALPEHDRYLPALRHWLGFKQGEVTYHRDERVAGEPKQTMRDLIQQASHCIFSFSNLPIRLITRLGVFATTFSVVMAFYYIIKRLFFHDPAATGFTTLLTMMVFLGGVQLISLGVMGQYIARIHQQSRGRPLYVVRRVHQKQAQSFYAEN